MASLSSPAFVSAVVIPTSHIRFTLTPLSRRQQLPSPNHRRATLQSKTTFKCCNQLQKQAKDEDDQPLDELAMRVAEIHEVMQGLRDFKSRIIDDATKLAKKVRAPKKQLESALAAHPDIIKIDGHIAQLEEELRVLENR